MLASHDLAYIYINGATCFAATHSFPCNICIDICTYIYVYILPDDSCTIRWNLSQGPRLRVARLFTVFILFSLSRSRSLLFHFSFLFLYLTYFLFFIFFLTCVIYTPQQPTHISRHRIVSNVRVHAYWTHV